MAKKPPISDEDSTVFRDAVRGIKPIEHTKITPPTPITPRPKVANKTSEPELDIFSDYETLEPVGSEDLLEYAKSGVQHKILRNLRNGKYNVEAILDLHGMSVAEARIELGRFLQACQHHDFRHVLIIHGKGRSSNQPILKNKLNHWLRQTDQVLAFCSATVRDGRGGSLYVLLKKETSA